MTSALLWLTRLSAIPAIIVGIRDRRSVLWYYALVSFICDMGLMLLKNEHINNGWLSNLFILSEFVLVSFAFKALFKNEKALYTWLLFMALGFIIYTLERPFLLLDDNKEVIFNKLGKPILFYDRVKAIQTANMLGAGFFLLVYIVYGVKGLYSIIKKQDVIFLERSWFFWMCCAFIVYASGCFPIFLFKDEMIKRSVQNYMSIWAPSFYVFNTVKNILIAIAIYHFIKNKKKVELI